MSSYKDEETRRKETSTLYDLTTNSGIQVVNRLKMLVDQLLVFKDRMPGEVNEEVPLFNTDDKSQLATSISQLKTLLTNQANRL